MQLLHLRACAAPCWQRAVTPCAELWVFRSEAICAHSHGQRQWSCCCGWGAVWCVVFAAAFGEKKLLTVKAAHWKIDFFCSKRIQHSPNYSPNYFFGPAVVSTFSGRFRHTFLSVSAKKLFNSEDGRIWPPKSYLWCSSWNSETEWHRGLLYVGLL